MQESKSSFKAATLLAIAIALLLALGLAVWRAKEIVNDELTSIAPIPAKLSLPDASWENVAFSTSDSVSLAGWYSPSQNGQTIVVMHGFGANRSQVFDVSSFLKEQGFGVFTYDTRAHGESLGKEIGYGDREVEDLRAALDWLERRPEVDVSRIGVYGFSLGGFIAAQEAVSDKRISSLVLAGSPSSIFELVKDAGGAGIRGYLNASLRKITSQLAGRRRYDQDGIQAVKALGESKRPILFIAGAKDTVVSAERTQKLYDAALKPKSIEIFPEAGHGDYMKVDAQRFKSVLLHHFKRSLDKRRDFSGR